ncbi:SPOSA6832_01426, partial [Sporobolomyces salmonicolor]
MSSPHQPAPGSGAPLNLPSRPPSSSFSQGQSFSRAASFQFTPRTSEAPTPAGSPDLGPTHLNGAVPAVAALGGSLSRHSSMSRASRPGSVAASPVQSPREEHKGTWCDLPVFLSAQQGRDVLTRARLSGVTPHPPGGKQALLDRQLEHVVPPKHGDDGRDRSPPDQRAQPQGHREQGGQLWHERRQHQCAVLSSFWAESRAVEKPDYSEAKIVVAMVGLPARGKSYLSNKLQRYLLWLEYEVFNVGQYRRQKYRELAETSGKKADQSANFFDASNAEASKAREAMASDCLEDLIKWLKEGGNVGIHDATNSTRARRKALADRVKREPGLRLLFIESVCTDPAVVAANIAVKVASGDPDYDGQEPSQAEKDFRERIKHYEESYQPLDEKLDGEMTYCKMVNVGKQVTVNRIDGYLQSRIAFYLMNLHLTPRSIYFTRVLFLPCPPCFPSNLTFLMRNQHGESQYNVDGQIGGDAPLSERGEKYMQALPQLIKEKLGDTPLTVHLSSVFLPSLRECSCGFMTAQVWTSTLRRTIQTASLLPYEKLTWKSLDELDAGVCDGMTYEEIEQYYPEDYNARDDDKFNYRYRGGESYRDVVIRLEPVILELERQENILVVCHQAVLRCLYGYLTNDGIFGGFFWACHSHNLPQEELPYIKIPLHTVIKLTPKAYGCDEERFALPIEAVDTTRPRPASRVDALRKERDLGVLSPSTSRPPSRGKGLYDA